MGPFFLTICAIVKDEALYLQEWLEFHLIQGVEHFFIYDNGSTDETHQILEHYAKRGVVTWTVLNITPVQLEAYARGLKQYGERTEWMAFIDADEFLYTPKGSIQDFLTYFTSEGIAGVAVRWYLYGSSGRIHREPFLVTERFLRREPTPNKHCKSIVRPEFIESVGRNAHVFYPVESCDVVNEAGHPLPREYAVMENQYASKIRINHYHVKAWDEFYLKQYKPRPSTGRLRPEEKREEFFKAHDRNEFFDPSASRHVNHILERIYASNINYANGKPV